MMAHFGFVQKFLYIFLWGSTKLPFIIVAHFHIRLKGRPLPLAVSLGVLLLQWLWTRAMPQKRRDWAISPTHGGGIIALPLPISLSVVTMAPPKVQILSSNIFHWFFPNSIGALQLSHWPWIDFIYTSKLIISQLKWMLRAWNKTMGQHLCETASLLKSVQKHGRLPLPSPTKSH